MHTLKALRHGSHSFTCKQHHACLSFVRVHQMALPLIEAADIELQLTTHLVLGWVTIFRRQTTSVFYQATQANSASYSQWNGK